LFYFFFYEDYACINKLRIFLERQQGNNDENIQITKHHVRSKTFDQDAKIPSSLVIQHFLII